MSGINDFQSGDRVRHILRGEEGLVQTLEADGLHVIFDGLTPRGNLSVGVFDAAWFRLHPDLLVNLSAKAADDEKRQSRSQWAQIGWNDRQQTPGA